MRENAFREKLFMILSIGDKRVRNYLLPRLGEPRPPAPSAASEAAAPMDTNGTNGAPPPVVADEPDRAQTPPGSPKSSGQHEDLLGDEEPTVALGALPHSADAVHSASDPEPDPVHGPALPAQHVAPADA